MNNHCFVLTGENKTLSIKAKLRTYLDPLRQLLVQSRVSLLQARVPGRFWILGPCSSESACRLMLVGWMLYPSKPRLANQLNYLRADSRTGQGAPQRACLWAEVLHHPWKVTPGAHLIFLHPAQSGKDHSLSHTELLLPFDLENTKFPPHHTHHTPLRGEFVGQISTEM